VPQIVATVLHRDVVHRRRTADRVVARLRLAYGADQATREQTPVMVGNGFAEHA
jgi:hypothetical protein